MLISAINKQTSDCSFYFIEFFYGISQTLKKSNSIVLAYIADVSVSANSSYIYMRTLSLNS